MKPTPGSQLALLTLYDFHAFITDRVGTTLELEADPASTSPDSGDPAVDGVRERLPCLAISFASDTYFVHVIDECQVDEALKVRRPSICGERLGSGVTAPSVSGHRSTESTCADDDGDDRQHGHDGHTDPVPIRHRANDISALSLPEGGSTASAEQY